MRRRFSDKATAFVLLASLGAAWPADAGAQTAPANPAAAPDPIVPPEYRVTQAVEKDGHLAAGKPATAFQFMMPDGAPVGHDYGFEGLPDVPAGAQVYPVEVNDMVFGEAASRETSPERQLANILLSNSITGIDTEYNNRDEFIFQPRRRWDPWFIWHYVRVPPPSGYHGEIAVLVTPPSATMTAACVIWLMRPV